MTPEELDSRFDYHAPDSTRVLEHERIRNECKQFAAWFDIKLPEGREKALAMTRLEEVMFWANAAIARQP